LIAGHQRVQRVELECLASRFRQDAHVVDNRRQPEQRLQDNRNHLTDVPHEYIEYAEQETDRHCETERQQDQCRQPQHLRARIVSHHSEHGKDRRQQAFHAAGLMGYTQHQIEAMITFIEAFAEVGEYFDEPVRTYSSGMQVRVAFAVATAFRPDILIVDEALSVGDAYFQAKCFKRVQEFKELGTTLILVSHSVADIVKHCDRVIFIKDGGVHADGPSREVSNLYLDELFGRKPAKATASAASGARASVVMEGGREDLFHTRRGYNKAEHRWGQGGARIIDYAIVSGGEEHPARIDSGARTEFVMKVLFEQDVDNAVPGILIKTLEGLFLYGTNSFLASNGAAAISAKAGDIVVCSFQVPMNVNEGHYMVSLGISSGDPLSELVPLDRRYDSILLDVSRPMQFWGIVDLHADFSVQAA